MPSCAPLRRVVGSQSAAQTDSNCDCMYSLAAMYVHMTHGLLDGDTKDSVITSILLHCELWGADWFGSSKGAVRGMRWGWGIKFLSGVVGM